MEPGSIGKSPRSRPGARTHACRSNLWIDPKAPAALSVDILRRPALILDADTMEETLHRVGRLAEGRRTSKWGEFRVVAWRAKRAHLGMS